MTGRATILWGGRIAAGEFQRAGGPFFIRCGSFSR